MRNAVIRYWSLAAAIFLPMIDIVAESALTLGEYDEVLRALVSVLCLTLLVHSWLMQRRFAQSVWRRAFWTVLLSLIALGPFWLGLNVIRYYSYAGEEQYTLYEAVVYLQDAVVLLAKAVCLVVLLWGIVDFARWLKRKNSLSG